MKITEELEEKMQDLSNKIYDIEHASEFFLQYLQNEIDGEEALHIICFYQLFNYYLKDTIRQFRIFRSEMGFSD